MSSHRSHQLSRKCQALCGLLSPILPHRIARRMNPSTSPDLMDLDGYSGSRETYRVGSCSERRVTINILPDDVLLYIFLIDGQEHYEYPVNLFGKEGADRVGRLRWRWHRLVHVCRRWRSIVFASPNYLDLSLVCSLSTPMRFTGIWPPLPIIITSAFDLEVPKAYDFDALIMYTNRVREICFVDRTFSQLLQRSASATWMQEQFPALTHLTLIEIHNRAPVLPDGFLGGSTPCLQSLVLTFIIFPALPKLLMSATHLVRLILERIPLPECVSPEAIVPALAGMSNLECLFIKFDSSPSHPHLERRAPLPSTRAVLPALTRYEFNGASEYLEDFVARIDAPSLNSTCITFFPQLIFDLPRLAQFMERITRFHELTNVHVDFVYGDASFETIPQAIWSSPVRRTIDESSMSCKLRVMDWWRSSESSLAHVFTSFCPSIHMVEHLHLTYTPSHSPYLQRPYDAENVLWLDILDPFTRVKNLYLSTTLASSIAPGLQGPVGGRTTEVLPTLQRIFLGGPHDYQPSKSIPEGIQNFVAARQAARQLFNPIIVSIWE